jgi:EAL domain-containing protein (putative c-di-GMP-specific phosphodiesterase class I)
LTEDLGTRGPGFEQGRGWPRGPTYRARTPALPLAAVALLVAVWALRFLQPDVHGLLLLALVPIALLAMMFGWSGGVAAAAATAAVSLAWAAAQEDISGFEYAAEPIAFFALGTVAGLYAHGALGDYDLTRQALRRELERAIRAGQLILHYQPIVSCADGETVAVEALVRWQHPRRGTIAPDLFIPAAERDPASIRALTLHTVELAAEFARTRLDGSEIRVAVNLSPAALDDPDLPDEIERVVSRSGLAPSRVELEITETAFSTDEASVVRALARLRELGVGRVVLDDFGVGHSSLARLRALAIDGLKVDRALAADAGRHESEVIVRAIVEMAHGLGLPVTAEGVEDDDVRERVTALGCDAVQGFGIGDPMPAAELEAWLARSDQLRRSPNSL